MSGPSDASPELRLRANVALSAQDVLQSCLRAHANGSRLDSACALQATAVYSAQAATAADVLRQIRSQPGTTVVYLLDIEGATTPLPFVTEVLFPAAERILDDFVATNYPTNQMVCDLVRDAAVSCPAVAEAVAASSPESSAATEAVRRAFTTHIRDLMAVNSKVPYLKVLQGMLWDAGYRSGTLKGQLFDDAAVAIQAFSAAPDTAVAIYSSGSVAAQQLLFGFSSHGDLSGHIATYFDPTCVGPKTESGSYCRIRQELVKVVATESGEADRAVSIVFLTDSPLEVRAAKASGAVDAIFLCVRPLNAVLSRPVLEELDTASILTFAQLQHGEPVDVPGAVEHICGEVRRYRAVLTDVAALRPFAA